MILTELVKLAERDGLLDDTSYLSRPVDLLLTINASGEFCGLVPTATVPEGKKKPKAKAFDVPAPPKRTNDFKPGFLVDNADYVLGVGATEAKQERAPHAQRLFVELVQFAQGVCNLEELAAVLGFYANNVAVATARESFAALKEGKTGQIAFQLTHQPEALVCQHPAVRAWWRRRFEGVQDTAPGDVGALRQCLVTGKLAAPAAGHEAIKPVPGGQSAGAALVSYNDKVYESYGFNRFENGVVSQQAAVAYARALNRLLSRSPANPRYGKGVGEQQLLPVRRYDLSQRSCLLFWAREPDAFENELLSFFEPEGEDVSSLLSGTRRGIRPAMSDDGTNRFFALVISGAQGRSTLRDWIETSLPEARRSVAQYFEDLNIIGLEARPGALRLRSLLEATAPLGDGDRVHPSLEQALVDAALRGRPLPMLLLQQVLVRLAQQGGDDERMQPTRWVQRAALIKAFLVRQRRHGRAWGPEITMELNQDNREPAYLLGRTFALLEKLQIDAVNPGATIRDRFYASASTAPASVFPRLLRGAQPHVSKARSGPWLHKLIGESLAGVEGFPTTLSLPAQGLFALGYYHQNQALYQKRAGAAEDASAAETISLNQEPDAHTEEQA